ncbi:LacI family DNA-binding transcriptional regulator [Tessaracoccus sp. G1721]
MSDTDLSAANDSTGSFAGHRPTMGDVARVAGVSRPLVSIVMRDAPGASDATRARVKRIAREMGYVPDERARKLRQKSSKLIGIAFELQHPFHGDVVEQIYLAAADRGYDIALSAVSPTRDEVTAVESLIRERCEALIVLSLQPDAEHLLAIAQTVPVVSVARRLKAPTIGVIRGDDRAGMRLAVNHLAELGHERIAHIDGGSAPGSTDRRASYRKSMQRLGLGQFVDVVPGGPTEEDGAQGLRELLSRPIPPTAVLAFNDRCAAGALESAVHSGLRVPQDLSIMGYDDSRLSRRTHVQLTTVSQDTHIQADRAVELAIEQLHGNPPREVVVQPHLVVRDTTQAPPLRA